MHFCALKTYLENHHKGNIHKVSVHFLKCVVACSLGGNTLEKSSVDVCYTRFHGNAPVEKGSQIVIVLVLTEELTTLY